MLRLAFIACGLLASALCAARPMVLHPAQTIDAPAPYYFFGYAVAIDGDWAIILAATPSSTPTNPTQTHDALLYHRINGVWTLDRTLIRRVSNVHGEYVGFTSVAMNNGLAAIGSTPTRIFRRTGNSWAEITHPFSAPTGNPDAVQGELIWDGTTLFAAQAGCYYYDNRSWGARLSTYNSDGTWSPLERLQANDPYCIQSPNRWGFSGNTAVTGAYTNDYEEQPDRVHIFRRNGTTWAPASTIDYGNGEGDVRGNEIFYSSYSPGGTLVYRNDDTQTVVDQIRTVTTSLDDVGGSWGLQHTDDVFMQDRDLFRKNAAGRYEHAALMTTQGGIYTMADYAKINRNRVISQAWRDRTSSNQSVVFFDLPATYTPSPVIATGFGNGATPFTPQLGTFAVANANGNNVYRQSSLTGEYRALLGNSDWIEQSIEADIKPTAFSGADRWAGLAVRYQDSGNYYYATLRSSGVISLRVMRNGVYTTLVQRDMNIVAGRSYHVSLRAWNNMITVRVDGRELLWWEEASALPRGSAALLGYRAAVDYDNVVAAQVGTLPIYDLIIGNCNGPFEYMPFWATNGAGSWNCSSGPGTNTVTQSSTADIARALVGTPTDDQIVASRVRFTSANGADRWFGIAARYVDESNYYYLTLRTSNSVSIRKLVNGVITILGTATLPVTANTWYDLRLDVVGNELRAFVNGAQVLQATDSSHASGRGGLLTYRAAAEYQNYLAWQP